MRLLFFYVSYEGCGFITFSDSTLRREYLELKEMAAFIFAEVSSSRVLSVFETIEAYLAIHFIGLCYFY